MYYINFKVSQQHTTFKLRPDRFRQPLTLDYSKGKEGSTAETTVV